MAAAMNRMRTATKGFTLIELLMVIALLGVLYGVAVWGATESQHRWQVRRAAEQVVNDLQRAQQVAERGGNMALENGLLVSQRTFLVFHPEQRRYTAYRWRDLNQDGLSTGPETVRLWTRNLPPGVAFGWTAGIDRKACSNVSGEPAAAITFASPAYAPCDDQPCLKFDRQGFSVMGPGAIYLCQNQQTLAITGTRPGHFTLCRWDGERWR